MKEILRQVILDQQQQQYEHSVERKIDQQLVNSGEILIISGLRRCGKSVLLQQIRAKQTEKDYFINFDDERLVGFGVEHFQVLNEVFMELFGVQKKYYFDEIQNIIGWERFVRRLYDSGNKVFITGSNATMLSKELGTHLTGRFCRHELYPFSFREYLIYNNVTFSQNDISSTQGRAMFVKYFHLYLTMGGIPQYCISKNENVLRNLYESLVYRDIIVRHKISNETELLQLLKYLATNAANPVSYNNLSELFSIKHSNTIKNYIKAIEDTYLLTQVYKYDYALRKQLINAKKCYFADNALLHRIGFKATNNFGQLLENMVFIELKRKGKSVFYAQNGYECDFLIEEQNRITLAIQVCYDLDNEKTKKREISSLVKAMDLYQLQEGYIFTLDTEYELVIENKTIKLIPVWKWLLI
ncbi:MAG: ATP-binding protein [Lentimicrobiaceae bacterium]|nr:ATP-binding protein [Lentimicrobiaceae bacterium]